MEGLYPKGPPRLLNTGSQHKAFWSNVARHLNYVYIARVPVPDCLACEENHRSLLPEALNDGNVQDAQFNSLSLLILINYVDVSISADLLLSVQKAKKGAL